MRSAALNLRTAVAVAVDGKSRAALFHIFYSPFRSSPPRPIVLQSRAAFFRAFCYPFCSSSSSSPPPSVLQLYDHSAAAGGEPALAAATVIPTPSLNLPPFCGQNAAGGAPGFKGLNNIIRPPKPTLEERRSRGPPAGQLIKCSDPADDPELISLADYCVQQFCQIQDSQYKLVKIVEADRLVVSGFKIWITLELSNQDGPPRKYRFEVWERLWLKSLEILSWGPVD